MYVLDEERGAPVATTDEVRLTVPAMPEFLRLTRVTAAGLASRLGFSFDEVEDLRLAIDELCYGLTGNTGQQGTMHVRYLLGPDSLVVEGEGHFDRVDAGEAVAPPKLSELSEVILSALVDEHELGAGRHGPTFRLVKRRDLGDGT
jgi:serine/threonine-protein kinase RsbW